MFHKNNISRTVGRNIRAWREVREVKQEYLASKLNTSKSAISQLENGHNNISLYRLSQIKLFITKDSGFLYKVKRDFQKSAQ